MAKLNFQKVRDKAYTFAKKCLQKKSHHVKSHFKGVDKTRQKLHSKHRVRIVFIMEKLIAILLTTIGGLGFKLF